MITSGTRVMGSMLTAAVVAATQAGPAVADDRWMPTPEQRLVRPIELPGCHLTVVEWRPSLGKPETLPSTEGIRRLGTLCQAAEKAFFAFVVAEGLPQPPEFRTGRFRATLSIIPYDVESDGAEPGNVNDRTGRFKDSVLDAWGPAVVLYGLTDLEQRHVFVRNDVSSETFAAVFSHEIFHAMSDQLGVREATAADRYYWNERWAQKFTLFMGFTWRSAGP